MFANNECKTDAAKIRKQIEILQQKLKQKTEFMLNEKKKTREFNQLRKIY